MSYGRTRFLLVLLLLSSWPCLAQDKSPTGRLTRNPVPRCGPNAGVDFRIMTDKLVYRPKSTMYLKFLVTNTGEKPLYLFRHMNQCGSQLGSYQLTILDRHGRRVPVQTCFADLLMDELDAVEMLTNPKSGIALKPGQIYDIEGDFELPSKPGKYRLKAELFPPGFLDKQRQVLAEKDMRVLDKCLVPAPDVTITVR